MTQHFTWSDAQDAQIRRLRAEGASWESLASVIGRNVSVVRERGRRIGALRPRLITCHHQRHRVGG